MPRAPHHHPAAPAAVIDRTLTDAQTNLLSAVTLEGVGTTAAAVRLMDSNQLVVFQYRPKRGFHVSLPPPHSGGGAAAGGGGNGGSELLHPLLGSVQQALDATLDVKSALLALVRAEPVMLALRAGQAAPGDWCTVPYTLGGFGLMFRGCFGLHVRYALDNTDAYSWSDMCPHTQQRPMPAPLEQGFMAHAKHTLATVSATADSLWAIPHWRALVAAVTDAANNAAAAGSSSSLLPSQRNVEPAEAAVGHYEAQRSSLVVGVNGLTVALNLLHGYLASQHLLLLSHSLLAAPRFPSKTPLEARVVVRGRHSFSFEITPPSPDSRTPTRLDLKVKAEPKPPQPKGAPPPDVLSDKEAGELEALFASAVAAPPYAPNRLRSFIHLLSLPTSAIRSMCEVLAEVRNLPGPVELALAPMYLLGGTEAKDLASSSGGGLKRGALIVNPRSVKASSIVHDAEASALHFVIRMWVYDRPAVEVALHYAYESGKLSSPALHVLGVEQPAYETASRIADSLANSNGSLPDVRGGQLWAALKNLLGSFTVAPPPAPMSI